MSTDSGSSRAASSLEVARATIPESLVEEEDDDTTQEVLYGYADLMIVGCRYYTGVAHLGEFVELVREPRNPYDRNALRVDNLARNQVGHIKATQASVLAPVLDDRSRSHPRVQAVVSVGGQRVYSLPIRAHVYGPPERAVATIEKLRGIFLQGGLTGRGGPSAGRGESSTGYSDPRVTVRAVAPDRVKTQRDLDEMFDKLDTDSPQLPTAETSACISAVVTTPLMTHQAQGLAWMVQREKAPDPSGFPPFWEKLVECGKPVFHNTITCSSQERKPRSVHGGILADEMGLGKTLQLIALILAQPPGGADYVARVRAVEQNKRMLEKMEEQSQAAEETQDAEEQAPPPQAGPSLAEEQERLRAAAVTAYKKMKKPELKEALKSKGLKETGVKDELITRLARSVAGLPSLDIAPRVASVCATAAAAGASGAGGGGGIGARGPIGTLVVCPMTVMYNWEAQMAEHVKDGALKVYAYHGGNRNQDVDFLAKCDVVITTYDTLASDFLASGGAEAFFGIQAKNDAAGGKRKRRHGLMALGWHRIVLDEAHNIRTPKTKRHQACVALSSRYRWCLTGTPLVNKPEDIGSLFTFLRLAPASRADVFKSTIATPISSGVDTGLARLRVLMKSLCLRRNKGTLGNKLPPKVVEVHSVEMDEKHREAYNALYNSARAAFRVALAVGEAEVMSQYASVLECLLRLRQVCCSTSLVPQGRMEQARKVLNQLAKEGPKLGKEEAAKLFAKLKGLLAQEEEAECAICLEPVVHEDARVLRPCGHGFCSKCLRTMCAVGGGGHGGGGGSSGGRSKCPLCRVSFTSDDIVSGAELEKVEKAGTVKEDSVMKPESEGGGAVVGGGGLEVNEMPPPKVAALLQSLNELRQSGDDKAVVFSQFTSFLDVIQPFLRADGFCLARIDGKMTNKQRQAELKRFRAKGAKGKGGDGKVDVMLASLMAAGTGVNLTSANHCFICDPWWNASVEEQAMDRVHRIGQTKPVRVVRMVASSSIENRILEIQEAKQALGKGALTKLSADELRKTRVSYLRTMFEC